jgi:mono/diheme cytochrome c family protein
MSGRTTALLLAASFALGSGSGAQAADASKSPRGHEVFEKWCTPCHGHGADKPGTVALATLYQGAKPAMLEERTDLTPEIVKHFVRTGVTVMPFFRKTEISDADLDALALYLSSPGASSTGG